MLRAFFATVLRKELERFIKNVHVERVIFLPHWPFQSGYSLLLPPPQLCCNLDLPVVPTSVVDLSTSFLYRKCYEESGWTPAPYYVVLYPLLEFFGLKPPVIIVALDVPCKVL